MGIPVACLFLKMIQQLLTSCSSSSRHFHPSLFLSFNSVFEFAVPMQNVTNPISLPFFMVRGIFLSSFASCSTTDTLKYTRLHMFLVHSHTLLTIHARSHLTLILRRSHTGTVWFYTSTSNKRAARPKLYTKSLTRDLKLTYSRLTLVRISINL